MYSGCCRVNVNVKAGPGFEDVLPRDASGNTGGDSAAITLNDGASIADLFAALGLPEDRSCMSALNDEIVTKAQRATTILSDGDIVDVLPPLTGG